MRWSFFGFGSRQRAQIQPSTSGYNFLQRGSWFQVDAELAFVVRGAVPAASVEPSGHGAPGIFASPISEEAARPGEELTSALEVLEGQMANEVSEIEATVHHLSAVTAVQNGAGDHGLRAQEPLAVLQDIAASRISQQGGLPSERHNPDLVSKLHARIERYLTRTNSDCVKQVFDKFADVDRKLLLADRLQDALAEFGSHLPQDEVDVLMSNMDIDSNGGLDLGEFAEALRQISTQEERFTKTLPITGMLASSLAVPGAADPLKELSNLEQDQLESAIEAFILSLRKLLKERLENLKGLVEAKEAKALEEADGSGSKCAVFVIDQAPIKAYHDGIYERIGDEDNTYR
jgi:hypothetical protein